MKSTQLLWKDPDWPGLRYDKLLVGQELALARRAQGWVEGKLAAMGFKERQALAADAWTHEAMSTSAIEGEHLDLLAVRSSVARRLGTGHTKGGRTPRHVDGLLDSMDDAVIHAHAPLSHTRLQAWQAALFPTGFAGMRQIRVGDYRKHAMQIVSGPAGRETVHYEAPPARRVPAEMRRLVDWLNAGSESDRLVQAGLAHLWFETIHPFDDGNGRVGRVLVDLILARDSGEASRLMRMSQRFLDVRDEYYAQLERAQHGTVDVTAWLLWFVAQVRVACDQASSVIDASLQKAHFWSTHREKGVTDRMRKVINTLLDAGPGGFEGGMSTRKYESLTGASRATASRDLIDLAQMGMLRPVGAGRATRYYINMEAWYPAGEGQH